MKQCDDFLKALCEKGVKVEELNLESDSIDSYHGREQGIKSTERTIKVTIPFRMKFMNFIMNLIQEQSGDIDYQTEFCLSDPKKIHEELLKEAIQDAKMKADTIAKALGLQVQELKAASPGGYGLKDKFVNYMALSDDIYFFEKEYISDNLRASVTSEHVETIWLIG
ncbi:MAG: SIMPL domain-containing protein [Lachnospiraceae bacterium]|nr:SIMPL domain-containing protein [Lachnospiraceae bacterium]